MTTTTGRLGLANSVMKFGQQNQNGFKQWLTLEDARVERYLHIDRTFLIVDRFGYMALPPEYNERMRTLFQAEKPSHQKTGIVPYHQETGIVP